MKLVSMEQYRRKEVIAALEELLEAARQGDIEGVAYVVKIGPGDHRAGTAGVYRRHPEKALQAVFQMERLLCQTEPFRSRY